MADLIINGLLLAGGVAMWLRERRNTIGWREHAENLGEQLDACRAGKRWH